MNFIKKASRSFMAGFDHRNPKRHTNLKCTIDSTSDFEGEHKPVFDLIRVLRDNHQYEKIVAYIEDYRRRNHYNGYGERLHVSIAKLLTSNIADMSIEDSERTLSEIQKWADRNRNCPYATTGLAEALNQVGWLHRGGGYANTVTEKGWNKFKEYTELSQKMMHYAQGLHADHWYWAFTSLRNVTEDQADTKEVLRRYDMAARHLPNSPSIYSSTVRPLLPRWGGNYELLDTFANQCAIETSHKFGDGAYSYVYSEILDYGEDVRDLHINRERFAKGCKDWLRVLPSDYLATTFASYAFLLADHNLCLDILESIDVLYSEAYKINSELTFVNSICRDETGR